MYRRNLNYTFASAADREYRTSIGTSAEATLLAQQLAPNPQIQRLQCLTQRALVHSMGNTQCPQLRTCSRDLSTMVTLRRLVAALEKDPDIGETTITSATRTIQSATATPRASSPCMATLNRRCNNPLAHLTAGTLQGLKVKLHPRPTSRMLSELI
jgi:hypothetical protein